MNGAPTVAATMDAAAQYDPLLHRGALRDRADLTLAAILRALLLVLPVSVVANVLGNGTMVETVALGGIFAYVLGLFFLQRRGHFELCVHAVVFGLIAFTAVIGAAYGSVRSVSTVGQVAAITMGGIFLGRRALVLATALSFASIAAMIYAQNAGWLPAPDYRVTAAHGVIYCVIIGAVAMVLTYMRALLLEVVGKLSDELKERVRAEAARQQSEDRFRRLFELSPVGMSVTRVSDARYLDLNQADERTLGYRREEMIGRTTLEMGAWITPEERVRFIGALRARGSLRGYSTRMRDKAGRIVECRIWADLVTLDGEECVLSSTVNVTDQELAERMRQQSEAKYAAIFNSAPEPIVIMRKRDAMMIEVNEAWVRTIGHPRAAVVGRSALELGIWADAAQRAQVLAQVEAQGSVDNVPVRFRSAGGLPIDALLSGISVSLDGECSVVWSWRDVTELQRAQAQERQIRDKFQALFETSPDGIAVTRWSDGVLTEANDAALLQIGAARANAIGMPLRERLGTSSEDRDAIVGQLRADGRIIKRETPFLCVDGRRLTLLLSAVRLTLDGEKCVVWSWNDITETRRAEEEKQQALEKFEILFETNPMGCILTQPRERRILEINDAALKLFGVTREQALARPTREIIRWVDERVPDELRRRALAGERVIDLPGRIQSHGGAMLDILASAAQLQIEGETLFLISIRDVTQQLRAQVATQVALDRFQKVFDHSPDAILISRRRDGVVLAVNDAWLRQNGYPRNQVVGRKGSEIGHWLPGDREAIMAQVAAVGRVVDRLTTLRRSDGVLRQSLVSVVSIDVEGEPGLLFVGRDVTEQRRAEEALRSSRRLLESVIDAIPMSIFAKDLNSNYIMVNKRMAEFFGLPKEALIRRHTLRLPIASAMRNKSLSDDEWVFKNLRTLDQPDTLLAGPDGTEVAYHSTKIPLFDDTGKIMGLLGINRDITEDKRAQATLRESEYRYRSLFQAATDCIMVMNPDGRLVDINESGSRALGYAREELVGASAARILSESKLRRLLGRPGEVPAERRSLRGEQKLHAKDGSTRNVEFSASPLPDGNILVVARDVTERRRQEKLVENIAKGVAPETGADFFRSLVAALRRELSAETVFIGELVAAGDRVRTNASCDERGLGENFEYALAGSPCGMTIQRRGTVIFPEGVAERFPEDSTLTRRGISGYVGTSLFDADGKAIGILVALTRKPIERKEFFISMLEIFAARAAAEIERTRAYTQVRELNVSLENRVRERTAELESANRQLNSFGYSVSHDLRSPLGAITGFADLLRETETGRLSGEGVTMLTEIEANATRMHHMLEGLLEFSRLGYKPVGKSPVPMSAVVVEVLEEIRASGAASKVEFRVGLMPDVLGEPILLRQVWANLLGNAVKYSRGSAAPIVEVGYDQAASAYFVRDNGIGFEMKYAGKLFGVFERLHSSTEFEGTGVGLAIVQRIVQQHGGEVRAESEPGRGATFSFTLPEA